MPGTRYPNAALCHSEHSEESRGEEILRFALNDKRPNAEGHPPLQRRECGSGALGKKGDPLGGGLKA